MKNIKKHTSFRLPDETLSKLKKIQSRYSEKLGIKLSQADIVVMLVKQEYDRLFNVKTIDDKPECPKCKGEESPHSVEKIKNNTWICHECRTEWND